MRRLPAVAPAILALGTNLGARREHLKRALQAIQEIPATQIDRVSAIYETQPVGLLEQPDFLNQIVMLTTALCPTCLLLILQAIETHFGRQRKIKWGPRIIDLDLITYQALIRTTDWLTLPHPRLAVRKFILVPFYEIAPDMVIPPRNLTVRELLAACPDTGWIRRSPTGGEV